MAVLRMTDFLLRRLVNADHGIQSAADGYSALADWEAVVALRKEMVQELTATKLPTYRLLKFNVG